MFAPSQPLGTLLAPFAPGTGPAIDHYHTTNVTALAGVDTVLNCRVYRSIVGVGSYYKLILWLDKKYNSVALVQSECTTQAKQIL